jgi:hypothetical protein
MKNLIVIWFILLSIQTEAQPMNNTKPRRQEIGIGYRIPPLSRVSYNPETGLDVMYKKFLKPNRALRFMAGFQNQNFYKGQTVYEVMHDTVFATTPNQSAKTVFIGLGMQMQRHFYKRIVFTGAIDTRFHYGRGRFEKYTEKVNLLNQEKSHESAEFISGARAFQWDLIPSIGVKFEFSRINFGIEMLSHMMDYFSLVPYSSSVSSISLFDFEIAQPSSRLTFNYRF